MLRLRNFATAILLLFPLGSKTIDSAGKQKRRGVAWIGVGRSEKYIGARGLTVPWGCVGPDTLRLPPNEKQVFRAIRCLLRSKSVAEAML